MRKIITFLLLTTIAFSQNRTIEAIDSVSYYMKLSTLYREKNNYKLSLQTANNALKYATINKDIIGKSEALTNLGTIYFELLKEEDAKEYFLKSINELSAVPVTSDLALNYYKLGLCYMKLEDYTVAENYFNEAENLYASLKIENKELITLQKGILYKNKGKLDLASKLFYSIISKPNAEDEFKTKAEALYQIADIELKRNRNNLALNYLNRALIINTANNDIDQRIKILFALSKVNDNLMQVNEAHKYLKLHLKLRDSLLKLNKTRLGEDDYFSIKESERAELFEKLNNENEEQQKINQFTKLVSILAISLICILSLLSFSLYRNNNIKKRSNVLLQDKNSELEIAKEKAEKASKARSDFLSTVSHELRTPLNAINGITHLLIEENPKESQIQYLNSLKFSGNYLLTFINEILEINRIESKNIEIEKIDFQLKELLFNIQNSLMELAKVNKNKFDLLIDENVPNVVIGDPTKMSQIFLNLINNALKFTKNGEVKVLVKLIEIRENRAAISFAVSDTGIGIAIEKQKNIFDSFAQGSIEINRKFGGTGLGLAIVKKLIELLGSEIKLESELGKGATFYFDLEMEISNNILEVEKVQEPPLNAAIETILFGKNVLIIEDNKINQMITKKMLERKGMSTTVIDNGEDAIEDIRNNNVYDLILMDVHLPGINGTIATREIRKFNTKIPIIALTAISLNENRDILLSFGMDEVITKPFDITTFYTVISKVLSNSKLTA